MAVIGLISAGVAVWQIMAYSKSGWIYNFVFFAICGIVALICGGLFLSKRVNKTEEIHITE